MRKSHIWAMWFLLGCAMLKPLQLFPWVVQYTCRGVCADRMGLPALPNRNGLLIWVMNGFLGGTLASQIDILDQIWCLGCCGCGKHHFFPITQHPWASSGCFLPSNPSWEDGHPWEIFCSSQSHGLPCLPSIISRRMSICGKYIISSNHPTSHWPLGCPFPSIIPCRMPDHEK